MGEYGGFISEEKYREDLDRRIEFLEGSSNYEVIARELELPGYGEKTSPRVDVLGVNLTSRKIEAYFYRAGDSGLKTFPESRPIVQKEMKHVNKQLEKLETDWSPDYLSFGPELSSHADKSEKKFEKDCQVYAKPEVLEDDKIVELFKGLFETDPTQLERCDKAQ